MKKYFHIALGTVFLFSITAQAQVDSDVNVSKTIENANTDPNIKLKLVTVESPEKAEPVFHSGIFGIRFMPTISSIKVQNSDGAGVTGNAVVKYGYGALLGFSLNNHVGMQVEVLYNTLSQKYADHTFNREININYVQVPLLLSLNTNRIKMVNLNFVVGPQWGINVGSSVNTTGVGNGNSNMQAVLSVKKNDFAIAYGAGLDFAINPARTIRIDLGFRGTMGIMDASDRTKTLGINEYYILREKQMQSYAGYIGLTFLL